MVVVTYTIVLKNGNTFTITAKGMTLTETRRNLERHIENLEEFPEIKESYLSQVVYN